jgi:hypothetical protein
VVGGRVAGLKIHSKDALRGAVHGANLSSRRANLSFVAAIVGSLGEINSLANLYSLSCSRGRRRRRRRRRRTRRRRRRRRRRRSSRRRRRTSYFV